MNGIEYGACTLFIGLPGDEELVPLGEVAEDMLLDAVEDHDAFAVKEIITSLKNEATFTVHMSKKQIDKLMIEAMGIKKTVLDMMHESGRGRVAHLVTHARKRRTRKKNLRRAFRIAEKEG